VLVAGTTDETTSYVLDLDSLRGWEPVELALRVVSRTPKLLGWDDLACGFVLASTAGTATRCVLPTRFFPVSSTQNVPTLGHVDLQGAGRASPALLWDPVRERLLFFGGYECTTEGVINNVLLPSIDVMPLLRQ